MLNADCGILLTNVGSPEQPTPKAVRHYLKNFLTDSRVVDIPRFIWYPLLYGWVLPLRARKSALLYQKIWTEQGSPLTVLSRKIAEDLQAKLQIPVEIGMHYGNPNIQQALHKLHQQKVKTIFILPLFPQYSATTTAVTFDQVANVLKKWRTVPNVIYLNNYHDNETYIHSICESILGSVNNPQKSHPERCHPERCHPERSEGSSFGAQLNELILRCGQDDSVSTQSIKHLLFSFHGIPEHCIKKGDPYAEQCYRTANLIAKKLNLPKSNWSLSFQSRLGRAAWLTPYTDRVLQELPSKGITDLHVICPGFAVDCLETLEEIAIRGKEQFLKAGGKTFTYIPALNASQNQLNLLQQITENHERS